MPDIDVGQFSEALNDKADRDLNNTQPYADYVIEWQVPTESNNYTWYRKYKSGWIEQGGYVTGNTTYNKRTIYLPITMANTYYHTSCTIRWGNETTWYTNSFNASSCGVTDIAGPVSDITTTSFSLQSFSAKSWKVEGMAA